MWVKENLRLRSEPSLESSILITVKKGEVVEVLGIQDDFTNVESAGGIEGWVASSFLSSEEVKAPPVNPMLEQLNQSKQTIKQQEKKIAALEKKIDKLKARLKAAQENPSQAVAAEDKQQLNLRENESYSDLSDDEKLNKIRLILAADGAQAKQNNRSPMPWNISQWSNMHYFFVLGLLIVGLVLGVFWSDFRLRRRHGGYRV